MKVLTLILLTILIGCSEKKERIDHSKIAMDKKMEMLDKSTNINKVNAVMMNDPILDAYFTIQEKLVNDSQEGISEILTQMKSDVMASNYSMKEKLNMAVDAMMNAPDIKEVRVAFSPMSQLMLDYVKSGSLSSNVYVMHCPMAFNNIGADWLQNSDQLYNPYFGSKMLRCGSTKETIAAK
jgi:hypothetical protein